MSVPTGKKTEEELATFKKKDTDRETQAELNKSITDKINAVFGTAPSTSTGSSSSNAVEVGPFSFMRKLGRMLRREDSGASDASSGSHKNRLKKTKCERPRSEHERQEV